MWHIHYHCTEHKKLHCFWWVFAIDFCLYHVIYFAWRLHSLHEIGYLTEFWNLRFHHRSSKYFLKSFATLSQVTLYHLQSIWNICIDQPHLFGKMRVYCNAEIIGPEEKGSWIQTYQKLQHLKNIRFDSEAWSWLDLFLILQQFHKTIHPIQKGSHFSMVMDSLHIVTKKIQGHRLVKVCNFFTNFVTCLTFFTAWSGKVFSWRTQADNEKITLSSGVFKSSLWTFINAPWLHFVLMASGIFGVL